MAIRRAAVRPDPQTGMVSREAHIQAFMDLEAICWMAGGVASVITDRARTDVPGEMVTTFAVVEWKDRTDAKPSPEVESHVLEESTQPEPVQNGNGHVEEPNLLNQLAQQLDLPLEEVVARLAGAAPEAGVVAQPEAEADADPAEEPEEDLSSIPEHLR